MGQLFFKQNNRAKVLPVFILSFICLFLCLLIVLAYQLRVFKKKKKSHMQGQWKSERVPDKMALRIFGLFFY